MTKKSLDSKDFSRLTFGVTLARHTAKKNLTELNNVFWFGERAHGHSRDSYAAIPFHALGKYPHGRFVDENSWKRAADQFEVWRRQHILISISSLIEIYFSAACGTTLNAMPELIDRGLLGYDSVIFLKYPDKKPDILPKLISELMKQVTKGSWHERFSRLRRTFGRIPESVLSQTSKLQKMQDTRNKIAHSLGETGNTRRAPWEPRTAIEVGTQDVTDAFKTAEKLIAALDKDIFAPKIGLFDLFQEYHLWITKQKHPNALMVSGRLIKDFRNHVGNAFGKPPDVELTEKLVNHYYFLKAPDNL